MTLVLIGGPSGSGKTRLINELTSLYPKRYVRAPSFTSRPQREGEDTREYTFVSDSELQDLHSRGELFSLDEAYGNLYAISRTGVYAISQSGRFAVKEVHPLNHPKFRASYPSVLSILLLPEHPPVTDALSNWDSERRRRLIEDIEFYKDLNIDQFDIVCRIHPDETFSGIAQELDSAIRAHVAER